jgi:hypothetical protein
MAEALTNSIAFVGIDIGSKADVFLFFRNRLDASPKSIISGIRPTHRGAVARRHERGLGCGGRGSAGAIGNRRASFGL